MVFAIQESTERVVCVKHGHSCVTVVFLDVDANEENKVFWTGIESSPRATESYRAFAPGVWQGTQNYQKVTAFEIISGL